MKIDENFNVIDVTSFLPSIGVFSKTGSSSFEFQESASMFFQLRFRQKKSWDLPFHIYLSGVLVNHDTVQIML